MDRSPRRRGHRGLQSIQLRRKGQKRHKARTYVGLPRSKSTVVTRSGARVTRSGHSRSTRGQRRVAGYGVSARKAAMAPNARNGPNAYRATARLAAVADEQDGACEPGGERPEEQRRQDGGPEGRAQEQCELHVAHPEPGRVRQAEHEQARERAGAVPDPGSPVLRVARESRDEDERRRRQDDAVRQPVRLVVDQRQDDEDRAGERRDRTGGAQAVAERGRRRRARRRTPRRPAVRGPR